MPVRSEELGLLRDARGANDYPRCQSSEDFPLFNDAGNGKNMKSLLVNSHFV